MTRIEYVELKEFPIELVALLPYQSDKTNLKRNESFIGIKKQTIGCCDESIIDENGHPHYFAYCDLKKKLL